jgi:hypothetical protein
MRSDVIMRRAAFGSLVLIGLSLSAHAAERRRLPVLVTRRKIDRLLRRDRLSRIDLAGAAPQMLLVG